MKTLFLPLVLLLSTLPHANAELGPGHGTGPAHPSAFLCNELNGQRVFGTGPKGTIEYCTLDEAKMSSMSLWITINGHTEVAAKIYLSHPRPPEDIQDATAYCTFTGGEPQTIISYDQRFRSDECVFNENGHLSSIDQQTLFRGPYYPGNQWLTRLLSGHSSVGTR